MAALRTELYAMGSQCEISVTAVHGTRSNVEVLQAGVGLVQSLEQLWSRFLPGSDVSRINANSGRWTTVSSWTRNAIMLASAGRDHTDGRYNPLLGLDLARCGYDRPFAELETLTEFEALLGSTRDAWLRGDIGGDIDINVSADCARPRVRIPSGTAIDLGGIGKGYAGDLVSDALLALGATGVLVNMGGDVRVAGDCPEGDHWSIQVGDRDEVVLLDDGAVAFTTTNKRRWRRDSAMVHHLLDPVSGSSLGIDVPMVCVVSAEGWWSEVLTKSIAVHIARQDPAWAELETFCEVVPNGVHAIVTAGDSTVATTGWNSVSARYVHV